MDVVQRAWRRKEQPVVLLCTCTTTCAVPAVGVLQSQQIRIADVSTISKSHQLPEISGEEEAETIKAVVNNSTAHLISPQRVHRWANPPRS